MTETHKVYNNEVYVRREFARWITDGVLRDDRSPMQHWLERPEAEWLGDQVRDVQVLSEPNMLNWQINWCVRGYIRDSDYTMFLLRWS